MFSQAYIVTRTIQHWIAAKMSFSESRFTAPAGTYGALPRRKGSTPYQYVGANPGEAVQPRIKSVAGPSPGLA